MIGWYCEPGILGGATTGVKRGALPQTNRGAPFEAPRR